MSGAVPGTDTWSWLRAWPLDPLVLAAVLAAASAYALGLARERRAGGSFPKRRAWWWYGGLAAISVALLSPVDVYADVSFPAHMTQHLLLVLVAPPLLALGAPITLALRTGSPAVRRWVRAVLGSAPARLLARPVVGLAVFVGTPFVIHLSPWFDAALTSAPVHALEHATWLTAGLIYWWPIVGRDPSPHPMPYPARLLSMFVAMPLTGFLALSLYIADRPLYPAYEALPAPWGRGSLPDQRAAAALMWIVGSLIMIAAMLLVAIGWKRDEERRQRRREATFPPSA